MEDVILVESTDKALFEVGVSNTLRSLNGTLIDIKYQMAVKGKPFEAIHRSALIIYKKH